MKQVTKGHWNGYDTYVLHSEELEVTVLPRLGNQAISVQDTLSGREVVRRPEEQDLSLFQQKPYHFGVPLLVPPGRIRQGRFTYEGIAYQFEQNTDYHNHIHGLHRKQAWCVIDIEEDEDGCTLTSELLTANDPHWLEQFPVPLRLQMSYRLQGSTFTQTLEVTNLGEHTIPFGMGYHTWFLLDGQPERWQLQLPVSGLYGLDEQLLPTGELHELGDLASLADALPLQGTNLDTALQAAPGPAVANLVRNDGYTIRYTVDESYFKHWVLYTKGECEQYLCIEPYTWLPDAPNLNKPDDFTGLIRITPGETVRLSSSIQISQP